MFFERFLKKDSFGLFYNFTKLRNADFAKNEMLINLKKQNAINENRKLKRNLEY